MKYYGDKSYTSDIGLEQTASAMNLFLILLWNWLLLTSHLQYLAANNTLATELLLHFVLPHNKDKTALILIIQV